MAPFTIIAHRGDSDNAPENTLAAFDLALRHGFTAFETDVQLTADGIPVIIHCEKLERTTSGAGPVAERTLAEVQLLDAGAWFSPAFAGERVPSLREVLERYKGRAHIHLELKSLQPGLAAAVAASLHECGWADSGNGAATTSSSSGAGVAAAAPPPPPPPAGAAAAAEGKVVSHSRTDQKCGADELSEVPGLTITSFHLQQLERSMELLPSVPHAWLIQEWDTETAAAISTTKGRLRGVCPRANALTPAAVAEMRAAGLLVRAWGVKTPELLLHVAACGVDGATVNWPVKAARLLPGNAAAG